MLTTPRLQQWSRNNGAASTGPQRQSAPASGPLRLYRGAQLLGAAIIAGHHPYSKARAKEQARQVLFFQRYGDASDPSSELYPALDRLKIDDDPVLIAHGEDSRSGPNGRSPLCSHIGALKIGHLPQVIG